MLQALMEVCAQHVERPVPAESVWQWASVLALDVVLIAVVWQQWLGATGGAPALVLGMSVWMVYMADHWLDVRGCPATLLQTRRHRFVHRSRRWLLPLWLGVLAADLVVALLWLTQAQLLAGAALLGGCLFYLLAVHRRCQVPKEFFVALIFTVGAGVFQVGSLALSELLAGVLGLFVLAFANCVLIAVREQETDRAMGSGSLAQRFPASREWALCLLLLTGLLGAGLGIFVSGHYFALSASACGLLLLGLNAGRIGEESFHMLADAMLLLPGVWLWL